MTFPSASVLVAIDFSPASIDAARQAVRMADAGAPRGGNGGRGAGVGGAASPRITALHVVEPYWHGPELAAMVPQPRALAQAACERWAAITKEVPALAGVPLRVVVGHAAGSILGEVQSSKVGLLVMGEHGVRDAWRGIGHVAACCVQKAAAPVLLVKPGNAGPFRRVVVAADFSPTCLKAIEHAVRIAAEDGAALEIFHAFDDPWYNPIGPDEPPAAVVTLMPDINEKIREGAVARLREFTKPLEHELGALRATFVAVPARSYAKAIARRIDDTDADLLVIGTRAKWNLRDAFLGTTAERVIRAAPCSVLAIKPEGFEAAPVEPAPVAEHWAPPRPHFYPPL